MKKSIILNAVLIILIIGIIMFTTRIDYFFPSPDTGLTETDIPVQKIPINTSTGTNPGAPIDLIEFADYSCWFCKQSHPAVKEILDEYGDRINYVFKQLPRNDVSYRAAVASECARNQDMFMEYHDELMVSENLDEETLLGIAQNLDLNMDDFKTCVIDEEPNPKISQDGKDAQLNGIMGTPVFIVNGDILIGSQSYETLDDAIQNQLDPTRIATEILT